MQAVVDHANAPEDDDNELVNVPASDVVELVNVPAAVNNNESVS